MSKKESISRYNLIIKKLRKHPASFVEIADYLALESELQEYNFNISKRTFQRDIDDIRSIFNIDIVYDFSAKVYRIEFDQQPEVNERIMEAFDTFNALNISDRLSQYIHFEKRKPQGTENLYGIVHSIKNKVQIKYNYQKFWDEKPSQRLANPYALKEFNNRWYVLALDHKDQKIKTFALDRLTELEITKKKFEASKSFNLNDRFKYCFGIIESDAKKPETVELSFSNWQGKYIKTLPLHESQQILIDNAEELRIKLTLFITLDFEMELLSYGHELKVLSPKSLVEKIKSNLKRTLDKY